MDYYCTQKRRVPDVRHLVLRLDGAEIVAALGCVRDIHFHLSKARRSC